MKLMACKIRACFMNTGVNTLFPNQPSSVRMHRSAGFWMAALMAITQGINAVRAFMAPQTFATYMGLPVKHADDNAFISVYGLRALFLALVIATLLYPRNGS
jgi:hypothetical protein